MKLSQKIAISFLGFPIASFLIFLVYILIYLIAGDAAYIDEIFNILDIRVLIKELIVLGISMFISILSFLFFYDLGVNHKRTKNIAVKVIILILSLVLLLVGFAFIPIILTRIFLPDLSVFNMTFFVLWVTFIAVFSLIQIVISFVKMCSICLLNKKANIKIQNEGKNETKDKSKKENKTQNKNEDKTKTKNDKKSKSKILKEKKDS